MNRQQIHNEIVSALQDARQNGQTVTLPVGNGTATLWAQQADAIAGSFTSIQYHATALDKLSGAELTRFADGLAARLTYLLEPISTIEADPDVVQLRSNPPSQENDRARCYFELLARTGVLSLARYRKAIGMPRETVPMQLTHEVLSRLLVDFNSAAASI
jgi:hypothetical protein